MPRTSTKPDAEETRRAILRAAHDLFMEAGYRAVTTRMVAQASGIQQPLIYYHFADKEALYIEVQRELAMSMHVALESIAMRAEANIVDRLVDVVEYLRTSHQMNMELFMHDVRYEISPDARALLRDLFSAHILHPISLIFIDGIATGFLRRPDAGGLEPHTATLLVLSAIMHLPAAPVANQTLPAGVPPMAQSDRAPDIVRPLIHGLIYGMAAASESPPP